MRKTKQSVKKRAQDYAFAEKLLSDFDAQPAQITKEQVAEIEKTFTAVDPARARRTALASLALSGMELTKKAVGDRDDALTLAQARVLIERYASSLREFAGIIESAGVRIGIALCSRDDMQELVVEAEAKIASDQAEGLGRDPTERLN
jgi:hypothetical protein